MSSHSLIQSIGHKKSAGTYTCSDVAVAATADKNFRNLLTGGWNSRWIFLRENILGSRGKQKESTAY